MNYNQLKISKTSLLCYQTIMVLCLMPFRNNSLFVLNRYRKNGDKLIRVASRLNDGEL